MDKSNQQLIHTFGALADLGQEVANTGDFNEMVQTSMHLLLGTLALRRGAVVECTSSASLSCVAIWGLEKELISELSITDGERGPFLTAAMSSLLVNKANVGFIERYRDALQAGGIEIVIPMIVRGALTGFVLLGGKASGDDFIAEDFEIIRAMARHIGVGIHTHRLFEQVPRGAQDNR